MSMIWSSTWVTVVMRNLETKKPVDSEFWSSFHCTSRNGAETKHGINKLQLKPSLSFVISFQVSSWLVKRTDHLFFPCIFPSSSNKIESLCLNLCRELLTPKQSKTPLKVQGSGIFHTNAEMCCKQIHSLIPATTSPLSAFPMLKGCYTL